jgi:hypothetical protein
MFQARHLKKAFPTAYRLCSILPDELSARIACLLVARLDPDFRGRSPCGRPRFGPARNRLSASLNFLNFFSVCKRA